MIGIPLIFALLLSVLNAIMGNARPADESCGDLLGRFDGFEVERFKLHRVRDLNAFHLLGIEYIVKSENGHLDRFACLLVGRLVLLPENDHGRFLTLADIAAQIQCLPVGQPMLRSEAFLNDRAP